MKNPNSSLFGIEFHKPVKVLSYYGYCKANIQVEYEDRYVLNKNWSAPTEMVRGNELHRELIALMRTTNPKFIADNKETYLYSIKDGTEVAVLFKDNTVRFGKRANLVVNPDYFKIAKISSNGIF